MSQSRSGSPAASGQSLLPEDWFSALEALLVRDRELDRLAQDRFEKNSDPEKAPLVVMDQHEHRLANKLFILFRKYHCEGFTRCLRGTEPLPFEPAPEIEIAGLHAVTEWLLPAPAFPSYTGPGEQQEIRELRIRLLHVAKNRLRQLEPMSEAGFATTASRTLPMDGPTAAGFFYYDGKPHNFSPLQWRLLNALWDTASVPNATIGDKVYEGEDKFDGKLKKLVSDTNNKLLTYHLPFEIASPMTGYYILKKLPPR
jgi:hypothetical protein